MRLRALATAASFGFLGATAQAETNWYGKAIVGLNTLGDQSVEYAGPGGRESANAKFDGGFAGGGAVGYRFGNNWRLEGEVLYRTSELDRVELPGLGSFTDGDYSSLAIAVSGLYDFNMFGKDSVKAYVGAGLGLLQEIDIDFTVDGVEQSYSTDDLGFQLMFGANYDLGNRWFVDAEARYFSASSIELKAEDEAIGTVTADYDPLTFSLSLGRRF